MILANTDAHTLAGLAAWAVVARQPKRTMRWQWSLNPADWRDALDAGRVDGCQRRDNGEFVLLGRLVR